MSKASPARLLALEALLRAEREGAYVRDVLGRPGAQEGVDGRDAAFALRLALGATAARGCLDELIDAHLDRPGRLRAPVRWALRISAFEIAYLGTAPEVAVSQGVELARSRARYAAGLANAVLRRVASDAAAYMDAGDPLVRGARRSGLPVWLAGEIARSVGDAAGGLFGSQLDPPPIALHLAGEGMDAGGASVLPGCRVGVDAGARAVRDLLARDAAVVSDLNAQIVATAATAPGTCLEVGAGRGTKTFVMCATARLLGLERAHTAVELSERKCGSNLSRLERAGLSRGVDVLVGDGCDLDGLLGPRSFDTVLVDAPCSGTGTMRRHPEIPWRLSRDDVERSLPDLQLALLREAARHVAPGGQLIYATCSVLAPEDEGVLERFLGTGEGSAFRIAPVSQAPAFADPALSGAAAYVSSHETAGGLFRTVPAPGGFDGHFCARLVRGRSAL